MGGTGLPAIPVTVDSSRLSDHSSSRSAANRSESQEAASASDLAMLTQYWGLLPPSTRAAVIELVRALGERS